MSWSYISYNLWCNILHVWFISQAMVIFAYAVAVLFFDVYDMAIDTIFLCFCEYTLNSVHCRYQNLDWKCIKVSIFWWWLVANSFYLVKLFYWVKNLELPPSACPALLLRNYAEAPLGFFVSRVLPSCNVFLQVIGPLTANHKTTSPPFVLGVNELVSEKYVLCRLQNSFSLQYITALLKKKTEKYAERRGTQPTYSRLQISRLYPCLATGTLDKNYCDSNCLAIVQV